MRTRNAIAMAAVAHHYGRKGGLAAAGGPGGPGGPQPVRRGGCLGGIVLLLAIALGVVAAAIVAASGIAPGSLITTAAPAAIAAPTSPAVLVTPQVSATQPPAAATAAPTTAAPTDTPAPTAAPSAAPIGTPKSDGWYNPPYAPGRPFAPWTRAQCDWVTTTLTDDRALDIAGEANYPDQAAELAHVATEWTTHLDEASRICTPVYDPTGAADPITTTECDTAMADFQAAWYTHVNDATYRPENATWDATWESNYITLADLWAAAC